jgi:hypothetical protein
MLCLIMTTMKYPMLKIRTTSNIKKAGRKPNVALARRSETNTKKVHTDANATTPGSRPRSSSRLARFLSLSSSCCSSILTKMLSTNFFHLDANRLVGTFLGRGDECGEPSAKEVLRR